jgi:hypothetical protein
MVFVLACQARPVQAANTYFIAPDGTAQNSGSEASPWDIESALSGQQKIAPGDTLYLTSGTYRHPDRTWTSPGFRIALEGTADAPIVVRAVKGQRVTLDGKVEVSHNCRYVQLHDLEITVSETAQWDRRVTSGGAEIDSSASLSQGGLNILGGAGSKFINLVIHDMNSGVGFWRSAVDAEMYGCLIYNVGSIGPDRYHGPGIYTQNETGTKLLSDNILCNIYSTTVQAYGSKNAFVNGFRIVGNIAFAPIKSGARAQVLVGGGRPSKNIVVEDNLLYEIPLQVGYTAPYNEDAQVNRNWVVNAGLSINNYKQVQREGNQIIHTKTARPDRDADVILRPNRYDPARGNIAVFNWKRQAEVAVDLKPVIQPGGTYRIVSALDYYGPPVAEGTYDGTPIKLPIPANEKTGNGEFCAFVLLGSIR